MSSALQPPSGMCPGSILQVTSRTQMGLWAWTRRREFSRDPRRAREGDGVVSWRGRSDPGFGLREVPVLCGG